MKAQPATPPVKPVDQLSALGREIREAQDKLLAAERRLAFQTDDSAPLFSAMAAFAGAQYRIVETMQGWADAKQHAPPVIITDVQVDDIGARLALGCKTWSGGLVKAANRQHYAILLAALLVTALAGAGASWLAFGKPMHPECAVTASGGRICGVWVVPDKAR